MIVWPDRAHRGVGEGYAPASRRRGFTLVELLVVLSIVAVMTAVAVPMFSRMGILSGDDLKRGSRELYAMLRAAKLYAATYRVDTAIAYTTTAEAVGVDEGGATVYKTSERFRAIAMFYEHPHLQDNPLVFDNADGTAYTGQRIFVPVSEVGGGFKRLPGDSCVLPPAQGASDIFVLFPNSDVVEDTYMNGQYMPYKDWKLDWRPADRMFPAHIFKPSGRLRTSGTVRELYAVEVGYTIDTDDEERLFTTDAGEIVENTVTIEIQRVTGRIKVAG